MDLGVQSFYKDTSVFLTGATGFLGKVFIEKILRDTEVNRLYILIREKKNTTIKQRLEDMLKEPLFELLLKQKPDAAKRIVPIAGDCILPNLGITQQDRLELIANVNVIMHSAATVRFNEPLSNAVDINVRATIHLLQLAHETAQLKAFVHVSSAFANCIVAHVEEDFYPDKLNGHTAQEVCEMRETLGVERFDALVPELCGNFPNTYCYTKALAEEAVQSLGKDLPVCVFRPSIVISSIKEPMTGWIDNLYGPMAIIYATAFGILRVLYIQGQANAALVPVDYCANMMLVCAWAAGTKSNKSHKPAIYNLAPTKENPIKWIDYMNYMRTHGVKMPLSRMFWYPLMKHTSKKSHYKILRLINHTIPSYVLDCVLLLLGQKRRVARMYHKIHKNTTFLDYFMNNNWTFAIENTQDLFNNLSKEDKQMFPFDMSALHWSPYLYDSFWGMRRFLAKEEPSTVPQALTLFSRLMVLHYLLEAFIYAGSLLLLCWIFIRIYALVL